MENSFLDFLKGSMLWEGIDRLLVNIGALFCIWVGYKIYRMGILESASKISMGGNKISFWICGTCCVGFGALILLAGILTRGVIQKSENAHALLKGHIETVESSMSRLTAMIQEIRHTVEKQDADNTTKELLSVLKLKQEADPTGTKERGRDLAKTGKKGERSHTRKKASGTYSDNSSEY